MSKFISESESTATQETRMMVTIEELFKTKRWLGYYYNVRVAPCDGCSKKFVWVVNDDPGSVEEAIGYREFCDACSDNLSESKEFHMACLETETLDEYRKSIGHTSCFTLSQAWWEWEHYFAHQDVDWDWFYEVVRSLGFSPDKDQFSMEVCDQLNNMQMIGEESEDYLMGASESDIANMAWMYGVGPNPKDDYDLHNEHHRVREEDIYRHLGGM